MDEPSAALARASALPLVLAGLVTLAACTDGRRDSGEPASPADTDSGADDSGSTDSGGPDSGDTSTGRDEDATLVTTIEIAIEGLYAESLEGGAQPIGGPFEPEGVSITHVEPGSWWVTAYSADFATCNRSDTAALAAGDRLAWTVADLPGTFDADGYCVIP